MSAGSFGRRSLLLGASLGFVAGCSKSLEGLTCASSSGLSSKDAAARERVEYSDHATDPNKTCDACSQWIAPRDAGSCGACKVVAGPVHPKGGCKVFAPAS